MSGEDNGYGQESEGGKAKGGAPAPSPPAVPGDGDQEGQKGADHGNEGKPKRRWWPQGIRTAEWIMIVFTAFTALSAIAGTFIAHGQLEAMRDQLKAMNDATPDTKKLVQANQDLAASMATQATNTGNLVGAAKDSAKATKDEAASNIRLVTMQGEAVKAEREAAELTASAHKPLLRLAGVRIEGWPAEKPKEKTFTIKVTSWFINVGGSAVIPGFTEFSLLFADKLPEIPPKDIDVRFGGNEIPIIQNSSFGSGKPTEYIVIRDEFSDITDGKKKIFAFGKINYSSADGSIHVVCYAESVVMQKDGPANLFQAGGPAYHCQN